MAGDGGDVSKVFHALPPDERARGAIDLFGPRLGLLKAIGGHLTVSA